MCSLIFKSICCFLLPQLLTFCTNPMSYASRPSTTPISCPSTFPLSRPSTTPILRPFTTPISRPSTTPISRPSTTPISRPSTTPISRNSRNNQETFGYAYCQNRRIAESFLINKRAKAVNVLNRMKECFFHPYIVCC